MPKSTKIPTVVEIKFSLVEIAVIYSALTERRDRLKQLQENDNSVQLKSEIAFSDAAIEKIIAWRQLNHIPSDWID